MGSSSTEVIKIAKFSFIARGKAYPTLSSNYTLYTSDRQTLIITLIECEKTELRFRKLRNFIFPGF